MKNIARAWRAVLKATQVYRAYGRHEPRSCGSSAGRSCTNYVVRNGDCHSKNIALYYDAPGEMSAYARPSTTS